jgi:signal transduction histidine kinase/ActR/RegA family two-component response regulator
VKSAFVVSAAGSGFDSSINQFKLRILYSVMLIAAVFSLLFGLLSDLGINDIGSIHSKVDYVYSFVSCVLMVLLYKRCCHHQRIAWIFLLTSLLVFVSALSFVTQDEFRIIWFYFLIYVTYILLGTRAGALMSIATLVSIIACNLLLELHLSENAMMTAVLGLLIASLLNYVYTVQMERYESQLKSTIDQLDSALEEAQAADKTKSLFLANMSHEIRTPMNGVMGMTQAMYGTNLDEEQILYLDAINSSSKSLLLIIDDLLDLSKVESGKLSLNIKPFKTFDWLNDIHNVVDPLFENREVNFTTDIDPSVPAVLEGDATRLFQIAVNLLSNAAKFTHQGEVLFKVGGQAMADQQYLFQFTVKDTGIGIAESELGNIFDAFQQLSADRTSNEGVGLGLAICKRLAQIMGGDIRVESTLNKGTCFYFEVPLPVVAQHEPHMPEPEVHTAALNILLVDDDTINRLAATTLLKQHGHKVVEAEDGRQALKKLAAAEFDIILLDIHMPVMDGIKLTKTIRASTERYKAIPIIGLTASVMSDEKARYLHEGMCSVVEKPININRLLEVIYKLVNAQGNKRKAG